jgi:hypothetical protein
MLWSLPTSNPLEIVLGVWRWSMLWSLSCSWLSLRHAGRSSRQPSRICSWSSRTPRQSPGSYRQKSWIWNCKRQHSGSHRRMCPCSKVANVVILTNIQSIRNCPWSVNLLIDRLKKPWAMSQSQSFRTIKRSDFMRKIFFFNELLI